MTSECAWDTSPGSADGLSGPSPDAPDVPDAPFLRVALLGNPNTGKTTLFNRLCGLRHKTSNFPGTTQEARVGVVKIARREKARGSGAGLIGNKGPEESKTLTPALSQREREGTKALTPTLSEEEKEAEEERGGPARTEIHLVDLPGLYSLALEQSEAAVCREVLAGNLSPRGERVGAPDAVCVVVDATNLLRNLALVGEVLAQRLPTVVALNMCDLARRQGVRIDTAALGEQLGCPVVLVSARTGEGVDELPRTIGTARIPNRTPPGDRDGLERWADEVHGVCAAYGSAGARRSPAAHAELTDRLDRVLTHPVLGAVVFAVVMASLFFVLFKIATYPMGWIDQIFAGLGGWVKSWIPEGILRNLLADGVVRGIGSTVIFVPQIALLFFFISLLEDTGYLARAAFVMDRLLRPFGLPGHSFVPLLGSHACALPGILATRAIPDRRDRLATILVAPFMTCSARIPVYVLVTSILFKDRPALAALAFVGCYLLGMLAGLFSALIVRRTILPGRTRPMVLELPTYKAPSVRTALLTTLDRSVMFLRNAGTNILAICVVLWWLSAFPRSEIPFEARVLHERAAEVELAASTSADPAAGAAEAQALNQEGDQLAARYTLAHSFAGRLGRSVQPLFAPLGFDWQLTVGVLTSFAAREVFVSTMAVIVTGAEDAESDGVLGAIQRAKRTDIDGPVFTPATSWALLVFYVLAMQCLPTLAVTAREAGGMRWALLQLAWMSGLAYVAAWGTYRLVLAIGG